MDFPKKEIVFYATAFVAACIACLARIFRDNERIDVRTVCGRCASSGVLSFGIVAIWIGSNPDPNAGGFYWLAIAALIGYCSRDIQDQLLSRTISWLLKKFGGPDDVGK